MKQDQQLSTRETAALIGVSLSTLNNSIHTGKLAGVTAPPYRKLGKKVLYSLQSVEKWKSQFKEQTHTN